VPQVSREQWRSLCAAAGVPESETDVRKVLEAAKQRMARRFDPRRRDATIMAAVQDRKIPVARVPFWLQAYETDPGGSEKAASA
jgi:hypothetical protein